MICLLWTHDVIFSLFDLVSLKAILLQTARLFSYYIVYAALQKLALVMSFCKNFSHSHSMSLKQIKQSSQIDSIKGSEREHTKALNFF